MADRFLRRRIDGGGGKLAHQDVTLERCRMTNCRGAFQQMSIGLRSKKVMQQQEAGLDRLEIMQLTSRCQISTSVVASPVISVDC